MKASTFVFSELRTDDAAKARYFYAELVGWEYQDLPTPAPYALVKSHGQAIGGIAGAARGPSQWLTYIRVADVGAATAKAGSSGRRSRSTARRSATWER
jgi:predicted enzyme related to lactoylglutathione lyase